MTFIGLTPTCAWGLTVLGGVASSVPVYTNSDLERVAPYRDQTGVNSQPAFVYDEGAQRETAASASDRQRREEYWRREARRLRGRVRALERRIKALDRRIAERLSLRARDQRASGREDKRMAQLREQRDDLTALVQDLQSDLEERARRDGALPGWLR